MNQSEIAQPPKEIVYQQVLEKLEISRPEPLEGQWNNRVAELLDGEFFLDELRKYVNRPMIIDHIDDHGFRREWRMWAFENIHDLKERYGDEALKHYAHLILDEHDHPTTRPIEELLQTAEPTIELDDHDITVLTSLTRQELALILYEENVLRMNHIMKIDGIIDMLLEIEEPSGNLTPEEIQLLKDTRKEFSKATEKLPVRYDTFTTQEVVADVLKQLLANNIIPENTDVQDILSRLTTDPQTKVSELASKNIFSDEVSGIISQYLAEKTTLSKDERTDILRQVALILRTNIDGPVKYETPEFTIEMKVELVQNACDNLRRFLTGFIS